MNEYEAGIIITDLQYNVLKWNVAAERFCTDADGSFTERGFIEHLWPAGTSYRPIYQELERLIRKKSLDEHIVVSGPAGKLGLLSCYLHKVPEMKPLSAVVIIIRELTEYLHDARGREVMFRSFLNNSSNPSWISDEDGKIIYMNPAARNLLAISDDYQYKSLHDLLPPSMTENYLASDREVLRKGEALSFVHTHEYGEHAGRYFMVHKFLLDVPYAKKLVGGQAIDITAEKLAQEQIITEIKAKKRLQAELLRRKEREQQQITQAMIVAQDQERNELSKELHENVNQMLSSAMVLLSSVKMNGSEDDKIYFEKSKQYLDKVIQEIRRLSRSLNTSVIEEVGLKVALEEVINNIRSVTSMEVQLEFDQSLEEVLSYEQKLTAYRIIQHHTNNIIQHARAGKILISLRGDEEQLELRITDDGVGFDMDKTRRGLGFINIRNRVEAHGGAFTIETFPSNGCVLEVTIPLIQHITKTA